MGSALQDAGVWGVWACGRTSEWAGHCLGPVEASPTAAARGQHTSNDRFGRAGPVGSPNGPRQPLFAALVQQPGRHRALAGPKQLARGRSDLPVSSREAPAAACPVPRSCHRTRAPDQEGADPYGRNRVMADMADMTDMDMAAVALWGCPCQGGPPGLVLISNLARQPVAVCRLPSPTPRGGPGLAGARQRRQRTLRGPFAVRDGGLLLPPST